MVDTETLSYYLLKVAYERFSCPPEALNEEQRRQAERIARRKREIEEAVLASSEAVGVVIPPGQVDVALAEIQSRYEDDGALADELDRIGVDSNGLRQAIARELRVDAVLERVSSGYTPVSETDARLYYYMHDAEFQRPEIRVARHILVTINESFPENQRDMARHRIDEIARRLGKKPERFEEQALKHSECPTSLQGGMLGGIRRGKLFPELEAVLFSLKAGELSDVVESPLGFHLLYCVSVQEPGPLNLDEVLPRLRQRLDDQQRQRLQRRWLEQCLKHFSATQSRGRMANG